MWYHHISSGVIECLYVNIVGMPTETRSINFKCSAEQRRQIEEAANSKHENLTQFRYWLKPITKLELRHLKS